MVVAGGLRAAFSLILLAVERPPPAAASASGTSHRIIVGVRWPAESAAAMIILDI